MLALLFTFGCGKLGEFRRKAIGLSSDNGLLTGVKVNLPEEVAELLPFWTRSGGT